LAELADRKGARLASLGLDAMAERPGDIGFDQGLDRPARRRMPLLRPASIWRMPAAS